MKFLLIFVWTTLLLPSFSLIPTLVGGYKLIVEYDRIPGLTLAKMPSKLKQKKSSLSMTSPDIVAGDKSKISWMSPRGESGELARELLAGLVVALATIPTSISYSTIIGLSPLVGIWSSAIVGLIVTLVGGGPGLIAGAAGVIALPMGKVLGKFGAAYMGAAVILSGIIQILFGAFRLGKVATLVTEPVIAGFLNAFGLFLIKSQLKIFKSSGSWLSAQYMIPAIFTAAISGGITKLLPMVAKNLPVPPSLIGVVLSTVIALVFKLPVKSLQNAYGQETFSGGLNSLPSFIGLPHVPLSLETMSIIWSTALGAAMIGILETLLAERISCDATRCKTDVYEQDDPNRTVLGLGVANFVSALFGGFGGCGLIPNTLLNNGSGGEGYASGYAYSLFIMLAVVVFSPVIGIIPMATLAGLMFSVSLNTIEWKETWHLLKHSLRNPQAFLDCLAMIASCVLCFKVDMGVGVLVGVIITKLLPIMKAIQSFAPKKKAT